MRFATTLSAVAVAIASVFSAGAAAAADMPSSYYAVPTDDGQPDPPLEFGAGWYLRGDASFGPENMPKLVSGPNPSFGRGSDSFGYAFGGGAGYKFNGLFRADLTGDYLDAFSYHAQSTCGTNCLLDQRTTVKRWDALANGYVDLGTWYGVTPYLGAGLGVSGTQVDASAHSVDPRTGTLATFGAARQTDYQFAWAAMAGFSYAFAPHALVDIGYRYLDLGKTTIPLYQNASVTRNLTEQQIRLGVRYVID